MVSRRHFDNALLRTAIEAGAAFTVGAGKSGDVTLRATGARRMKDYPRAGICMEHDYPAGADIDEIHIHYGFGGIKGYAWLFPKEEGVNIGIGAYHPQTDVRGLYFDFIDHLAETGVVSVRDRKYRSHIIPFAPRRRFFDGGELLLGDAAGLVNPSTGEGIYFAMLSGKIAARMILEERNRAWYDSEVRRAVGEYLTPVSLGWNRTLLNRVMEMGVEMCNRDEVFKRMVFENVFRLGPSRHRVAGRFVKNLLS
jgi:flavin-dependent dehydrogenase